MTILSESLVPLVVVAAEAPGGPVNISTARRWAHAGCRGIVLETVMRGGIRMTSREALARFFERLTAASGNGRSGQLATA